MEKIQEYAEEKEAVEPEGVETDGKLSCHSARMGSIRGHPFNDRGEGKTDAGEPLDPARIAIRKRRKREQLQAGQKLQQQENQKGKPVTRLSFGDEESGMVQGAGMIRRTVSAAANSVRFYAHGKGGEAGQENTAVEGAYQAKLLAERSLRSLVYTSGRMAQRKMPRLRYPAAEAERQSRLQFETLQEASGSAGNQASEEVRSNARKAEQAEKNDRRQFQQKQWIKKSYQAAKRGERTTADASKATQSIPDKMLSAASSVIKHNKGILVAAAVCGLLFLMVSAGLSSCSVMTSGASSSIAGTTYLSTDQEIYETENAYAALEEALNRQVNNMESTHPGFAEYRYQVDEISHNPYQLVSYFTVKYGEFTYSQAADELEEIFREQYSLYVDEINDTVTETKTVRVGESLGQVVTSGYCSCSICCGSWAGSPTASGAYPTAGHTLAVDASDPFVPLGTRVVLNGIEYVVEDTGAFARYGVQFDVYYDNHTSASAHGHQVWEAYIADSNGSQEVEVTTTEEISRLEVSLKNYGLDSVLRGRMDTEDQKRYDIYNATFGNRDYLFEMGSLPQGADGFGYEIPAEALADETFAKMVREAEKYLGYPYVWGGASPDTSFDCSGFVSWVINHCGNGWDVGKQAASGLQGCCVYVTPDEARPGDLVFFEGTYPASGASHVGIYVGDGMMVHCGNPVQYANINSPYWQQHFRAFGRLP